MEEKDRFGQLLDTTEQVLARIERATVLTSALKSDVATVLTQIKTYRLDLRKVRAGISVGNRG